MMIAELTEKVRKNIDILLAIIGVITSFYIIAYKAFNSDIGICSIDYNYIDCDKVIFSKYSKFLGIDLGYWALFWFALYIILKKYQNTFRYILDILIGLGASVVIYLIYVEIIVIGAICILCTVLHIAILGIAFYRYLYLKHGSGQ